MLLQADQRLKQNQEDLVLLAHFQELYLFVKEYGLILNQELNPIKRKLPREEDGAIDFWRLKYGFRSEIENSQHWSDEMCESKMAGGGGNKKRVSILY